MLLNKRIDGWGVRMGAGGRNARRPEEQDLGASRACVHFPKVVGAEREGEVVAGTVAFCSFVLMIVVVV